MRFKGAPDATLCHNKQQREVTASIAREERTAEAMRLAAAQGDTYIEAPDLG